MDQDAAWGRLIIFFNDNKKNKKERTNSLVGLNSNNTRTRTTLGQNAKKYKT